MAFADFEYRDGSGYYRKDDYSGPYWLDDSGDGTLLSTSFTAVSGASTNPDYEYRDGAGWFKKSTGAGPYVAS